MADLSHYSTRCYQAQFRTWEFPSKHSKLVDEPGLHDRVKELWGKNYTQQRMVEILQGDGYNVNSRQVARLRSKDGLKLRHNAQDEQTQEVDTSNAGEVTEPTTTPARQIPLELQIARQAKQAALWTESAERLKNRTRRRRTKGWNGLPADPGLPPRFPSELTLEENRQILNLDKALYKELRITFKDVCREHGVERKAGCAPGMWQYAKDDLINRIPHLQSVFHSPQAATYDPTREPMALDLICMDVTKSMRVATKTITLTDAKNILNLSPTESREVRLLFEDVLKANYFVNRRDVTKDEWETFKSQWIQQTPLLQREFSNVSEIEVWNRKQKALEIIARDVHKRHRDYMIPRDTNASNKRKAADKKEKEASPKKAKVVREKILKVMKEKLPPTHDPEWRSPNGRPPWMPSTPPPPDSTRTAQAPEYDQTHRLQELAAAAQIDPDLLAAAATPDEAFAAPATKPAPLPPTASMTPAPPPQTTTSAPPTAIFIRLSPSTLARYPHLPKVWIGHLSQPYTLGGLNAVLDKKLLGVGGEGGRKVDGLADGAAVDNEVGVRWSIEEDDELVAYVEYVLEGGGKLAFMVEVA